MPHTTLIVPGFQGSGPAHWQSWIEAQLPGARRVADIDWERPILARWANAVRDAIDRSPGPVWVVAHSFGCLASVTAAFNRPEKVRGALLVAPADPQRFGEATAPLAQRLHHPSRVIASSNDPWVKDSTARHWAEHWGSEYLNIGAAGHINVDSGHGPWPQGLALFAQLREAGGE